MAMVSTHHITVICPF